MCMKTVLIVGDVALCPVLKCEAFFNDCEPVAAFNHLHPSQ